ncbi:MAG: UdgX family uracil-DNA binding protein [Sphingomonadaceae bacterium]|nr:UdgX family uracil-DNA binding protein [Sphingomonadaceae bacterium]
MRSVALAHPADFDGWRANARELAQARIAPDQVLWRSGDGGDDLFDDRAAQPPPVPDQPKRPFSVPRRFLELAEAVAPHRDPERWALLYTALVRVIDNRALVDDSADPLMFKLGAMAKSVRRDIHKMRAFVRFRSVGIPGDERFVAWFEPEHHIVRPNSGFFVRRFAQMKWSILTPHLCVHWDMEALRFTPGATYREAPDGDDLEATWKTYYASIFNPARVKVGAMLREMPKKYWRNMPETALVPELIAGAQARERGMIERGGGVFEEGAAFGGDALFDDRGVHSPVVADAAPPPQAAQTEGMPPNDSAATSLAALAEHARACTRCPLYAPATQTVFGEGPPNAMIMFVGEQPGDQEDLAGRPFVGPAGQLFDRALAEAGVDRGAAYVTNAVKHFKFEQRGKRRIHAKPGTDEIDACRFWIDQERSLLRPRLTVALGATAARSLTGRSVTISRERGRPQTLPDGSELWITVHPSFLLRIEDKTAAKLEYGRFVEDLGAIGARAAALAGSAGRGDGAVR